MLQYNGMEGFDTCLGLGPVLAFGYSRLWVCSSMVLVLDFRSMGRLDSRAFLHLTASLRI